MPSCLALNCSELIAGFVFPVRPYISGGNRNTYHRPVTALGALHSHCILTVSFWERWGGETKAPRRSGIFHEQRAWERQSCNPGPLFPKPFPTMPHCYLLGEIHLGNDRLTGRMALRHVAAKVALFPWGKKSQNNHIPSLWVVVWEQSYPTVTNS